MGFTPKEMPTGAFPIPDIPYSAWITSNLTSGKPVGDRLTIALCWKPTNGSLMRFKPGASGYKPDHYRLTIIKSYGSVYVWDDFTKISTKHISTHKIPVNDSGAFLQKVLELVAGCHHGYYSHVKVMDECLGHPQDFYGVHPVNPSIIFAKEIHSLLRPTAIWVRGGEATASSEYNSTYSAGKAFDGSEKTGTGWISKTRGTGWLSYVWVNTPKVITAYRLISTVGGSDNSRVPSTFSFKARKTGGDWVLLDKYVGKTSETWAGKLRTFENNTAYNEYRLNISATRGNREALIRELKLCEQQPLTSYGSNGGFYDFADAANLGKDLSGKNNHWTVTGFQTVDTPTNNFAMVGTDGFPTIKPTFGKWSLVHGSDLCNGGVASSSNYRSAGETADKAFDGVAVYSDSNKTHHTNPDRQGWLQYKFAHPKRVTRFRFWPYPHSNGYIPKNISILCSNDGIAWKTLVSGWSPSFVWGTWLQSPEFDTVTPYRYVRMAYNGFHAGSVCHILEAEFICTKPQLYDLDAGDAFPRLPADTDFGARGQWTPPNGFKLLCIKSNPQ